MGAFLMSFEYEYPRTPPLDETGNFTPAWSQWIQRTHKNARMVQESGPTTQRPTAGLWIGRFWFDETLGIPVWVKTVPPKPAAAVWVNSAGAPV